MARGRPPRPAPPPSPRTLEQKLADAIAKLELDPERLASPLNLPAKGVSAVLNHRASLDSEAAACAEILVSLHASLDEVTSNPGAAAIWLRRKIPELGATPAELISSREGLERVHNYVQHNLVGLL